MKLLGVQWSGAHGDTSFRVKAICFTVSQARVRGALKAALRGTDSASCSLVPGAH